MDELKGTAKESDPETLQQDQDSFQPAGAVEDDVVVQGEEDAEFNSLLANALDFGDPGLEESLESLRGKVQSLQNTLAVLNERYEKKCREYDSLMMSYIKIREKFGLSAPASPGGIPRKFPSLPQPAAEYRKLMGQNYWN